MSGGQRRRVSIGSELVTSPKLIFLDEPTSGLDSAAAFYVMSAVRRLAEKCRTIISVIHQPSSEVFALFDKVGWCVARASACSERDDAPAAVCRRRCLTVTRPPHAMPGQLCLLSDGHVVYFGAASRAADFFAEAGLACPVNRNPVRGCACGCVWPRPSRPDAHPLPAPGTHPLRPPACRPVPAPHVLGRPLPARHQPRL